MEKHNENLDNNIENINKIDSEMTSSFSNENTSIEVFEPENKKDKKKLDKEKKKLEKFTKAEYAKHEKAAKAKEAKAIKLEKKKLKEETRAFKMSRKNNSPVDNMEIEVDIEKIDIEDTTELNVEVSEKEKTLIMENIAIIKDKGVDIEDIEELEINQIDPNETELTRVLKKEFNIGKTEKEVREKTKRTLKFKTTASTILLGLIILFAGLSWFLGGQEYNLADNSVINIPNQRYGLFDVLRLLEKGFINDIGGIWFLLIASGSMGVFIRTGALQALMQKMKGSKFFTPRKSLIFVMVLISITTTMFNANYLLVALAVFVVPLLVFNGYDIITALMALLFASAAGQMASVFNGELIVQWVEVMNDAFEGGDNLATIADGLVFRIIVFMLFTTASIVIVSNYGDKILEDFTVSKSRRETSKFIQTGSVIFGNKGKELMTTRKKVILSSFFTLILISLIGVVPWHEFGFTMFYDESLKWSHDGNFMRIIWGDTMSPIGEWGYLEISYMFILFSVLVGFMSAIPQRKYLQGMTRGMNTALNIVLILTLSGALYTMLSESGLHYTIFYSTLSFFKETFGDIGVPIGAFFSSIAFSVIFPMTQDLMTIIAYVMPRIIIDMSGSSFEFVMFIGTSITIGAGLISIILPTSAITIGLIWAYKIPFNKWLTSVWKPLLQFAAVSTSIVVAFTLLLT